MNEQTNNQPWTRFEDEALKKAYKEGRSIDRLAHTHYRSEADIIARLQELGFVHLADNKVYRLDNVWFTLPTAEAEEASA